MYLYGVGCTSWVYAIKVVYYKQTLLIKVGEYNFLTYINRLILVFPFQFTKLLFDYIQFIFQDINGSTLTISSVSVDQSGNYTCQPSNMKPDSVVVTILQESKSANALQVQ